MLSVVRSIVAVMAGLLAALILLIAVEAFSAVVHPFPADFDGSTEQVCQHVARYPAWVLAVVIPLWFVAEFAALWASLRIGTVWSFFVVAVLLAVALIGNLAMLPYPVWFKAANPLALLAAMWLVVRRRPSVPGP